jgi:hypothetical protein
MYKDNTPIELYNVQDQVDNTPELGLILLCATADEKKFLQECSQNKCEKCILLYTNYYVHV